jgi:hypothetical protein
MSHKLSSSTQTSFLKKPEPKSGVRNVEGNFSFEFLNFHYLLLIHEHVLFKISE